MNNLSLLFSVIALLISFFALINSWLARKQSQKDSIFNLKEKLILKSKESEIEWQKIVNELDSTLFKVKKDLSIDVSERNVTIDWLSKARVTFCNSLSDAQQLSSYIDKKISTMSEKEIKQFLIAFAGTLARLSANREAMRSKLSETMDASRK